MIHSAIVANYSSRLQWFHDGVHPTDFHAANSKISPHTLHTHREPGAASHTSRWHAALAQTSVRWADRTVDRTTMAKRQNHERKRYLLSPSPAWSGERVGG